MPSYRTFLVVDNFKLANGALVVHATKLRTLSYHHHSPFLPSILKSLRGSGAMIYVRIDIREDAWWIP